MTDTTDIVARLRECEVQIPAPELGVFMSRTVADPLCTEAAARIEALEAEVAKLRGALEKCEAQFRFYADNHRAKGTPDGDEKAKTNDDMADACRAALASLKGQA